MSSSDNLGKIDEVSVEVTKGGDVDGHGVIVNGYLDDPGDHRKQEADAKKASLGHHNDSGLLYEIWTEEEIHLPYDPEEEHPIFCNGKLLEYVQMARLYQDSKTFVDKKLKYSPGRVKAKFDHLLKLHNGNLTNEQLREFVEHNFDSEGLELERWTPDDWCPEPSILERVTNPKLKLLAKTLNKVWLDLSRKISSDVQEFPELYSIIFVPNGFVVPGGRFREFYYWDMYWIVKALLHCDMVHTVKGIIENFVLMVDTYGLVPNGGRIYYTKRSQPPFLTLMMEAYLEKTQDYEFLAHHINTLVKEMEFWESKRSLKINKDDVDYRVFSYACDNLGPRPESYREDVELAKTIEDEEEVQEFYLHMKAGAESGWDYSTRWMIDHKRRNHGGLRAIKTGYIIPVDLNSLMYMNYRNIANFYETLGDEASAVEFRGKAAHMKESIYNILWSIEDSMWFDYDVLNNIPRKHFYPSNLFPLWADCYEPCDRPMIADSVNRYLKKTGTIYCHGGVPTSLIDSGQQWDFPNAWPPLQHILVAGLLKMENDECRRIALTIARRYTVGTMFSCSEEHETVSLFEKYNANKSGLAGGGGEYEVQTGFGWSNGVVLEFMDIFGDELLFDDGVDKEYERDEPIELITHFDMNQSKHLIISRNSSSAFSLEDLVAIENALDLEGPEEPIQYEDYEEGDSEDEGLVMSRARRISLHSDDEGLVMNRIRRMSVCQDSLGLPRPHPTEEASH